MGVRFFQPVFARRYIVSGGEVAQYQGCKADSITNRVSNRDKFETGSTPRLNSI